MELLLIRGLPGSGKSTLASTIAQSVHWIHREADDYFDCDGEYLFDASMLAKAHQWCQDETDKWLNRGYNVVVSNTFSQEWEITPYRKMAADHKADLSIITLKGEYGNIHDVPNATYERMKQRFDWNLV